MPSSAAATSPSLGGKLMGVGIHPQYEWPGIFCPQSGNALPPHQAALRGRATLLVQSMHVSRSPMRDVDDGSSLPDLQRVQTAATPDFGGGKSWWFVHSPIIAQAKAKGVSARPV